MMTTYIKILAGLMAFIAGPAAAVTTSFEIIVPAYFRPNIGGSDWDRLTSAAASGVPITAIMNPGSGAGGAGSTDYVAAISAFRAAGGTVLGYVPSGYTGQQVNGGAACQPAAGSAYSAGDVVACARSYKDFYGIDGIFVDEMGQPAAGAPLAEVLAFYQAVYDGIKVIDPDWSITGNSGTNAPEGLLRTGKTGAADVLVTFENRASQFAGATPAAYTSNYDASRFGALLLETETGFDFRATLALAASRNIGQLYLTDDLLPNPYDRLPAYWDDEVAAVREFNAAAAAAVPEPATWLMLTLGFAAVGVIVRRRRAAAAVSYCGRSPSTARSAAIVG